MRKTIILSLIILCCWGCSTTKKSAYSYTVDTYGIDTVVGKHPFSFSHLISFGDYLFESKIRINIKKDVYPDSSIIRSVVYDAVGVYLLSGKEQKYYEFDSFYLKSKLIGKGLFPDKPFGQRLTPIIKTDSSDTYYGLPKDSLINGIKCFYADLVSKDKSLQDTVEQKVTLLKIKDLNSFYRLLGVEFEDREYCIVGINMYVPKNREFFIQEIKTLRKLTKDEQQICRRMIKLSGL